MDTIKPIETHWNGFRFRSRLEARWAIFFDRLGVVYDYEQQGFDLGPAGWYLPDFWLETVQMWAEIKPTAFSAKERAKCTALAQGTKHSVLMLAGTPGPIPYERIEFDSWMGDDISAAINPGWLFLDDQYLDEHRFFSCDDSDYSPNGIVLTGDGRSHSVEGMDALSSRARNAYIAARSARFEHGDAS